jgi:hypothetical protein
MQVTTRAVDPSAVTLATLTGMPCTAVPHQTGRTGERVTPTPQTPRHPDWGGARGQMALPGLTLTQYLTDA